MTEAKEESLGCPVDSVARAAARMILRTARYGALALTDAHSDAPLVARVGVATDTDGKPVMPISSLSGCRESMGRDGRAALLLGQPGKGDPLAHSRVALNGIVLRVEGSDYERVRRRYLMRHPQAEPYIDFEDFAMWRLEITTASFIAGLGSAYTLKCSDLETQCADWAGWHAMEASAVEHMNQDHGEATRLYATMFCGGADGNWRVTGLDPDGIDMALGDDHRRYAYDAPLTQARELRPMLVELASRAREQSEIA
ncbi:MAG TPA: pyridoxamine 5'-phosphate oxidase [Rhodospirillaceae bacterium]|nr:pyridoxamine 5'-phosphate oxidase [Rhodospirillaceae bacterium]